MKGQFEILGLAIVVVIISIGVFFLLSLSINDDQSDPAGQFFNEQFAQNTLDAFMSSTHPVNGCEKYLVADYYNMILTETGPSNCRQEATAQELADVLDTTITTYQGLDYKFEVRRETCPTALGINSCDKVYEHGACEPANIDVGRPGRQLISKYPYPGDIEAVLWLCSP